MGDVSKRNIYGLLVGLVLLGFALRLQGIGASSFWIDEGLTPLRSGYDIGEIISNRVIIQDGVSHDTHPPFYYLLVHLTRQLWGESDFSYRYLSTLMGVLLIPVVYQLGRRLESRPVGLLAALLVAVNPLQIWYSQEARMYTLLAWLGALGSYALWRAISGRGHLLRWFGLYLLVMAVAFYTHYTAIFLIAAQSLFWLWLLWRAGYRRLIGLGAVVGLLLLIPIIPFTVPRLFTGAETNYFYVPIWIMLQDVVHGFGLGLTADFSQWYVRVIDLGLAVVLVAGCFLPQSKQTTIFLLVYLLATVGGLAVGSLLKPMYMGIRHVFIGGPAFFLLVARGIEGLWSRPGRWAAALAGLVVLLGTLLSLNGLYRDPFYAKDDLRTLIHYVEQQAGEQDILLFHDAISLPLFWHYNQRPDLAGTALPIYPYLANEQTIAQLDDLAEQYERIWFVWGRPADKRDESELVRHWLEDHWLIADDVSFHGRFGVVRVTAFAPPAGMPPTRVPPLLDLTAAQLPTLQQIQAQFQQPAALPTLWFQAVWHSDLAPDPNLQLRLALRDPDAQTWLEDSRPVWAGDIWPQVGFATAYYWLAIPAATPAGTYNLMLQLWDKSSGANLTEWQQVSELTLADSGQWPLAPTWPFAGQCAVQFENGVALRGVVSVGSVRPGHPLPVDLYWQGGAELKNLHYQLDVVDAAGDLLRSDEGQPAPAWWQPAGEHNLIIQHSGIYIRPESLPGRYTLRWTLFDGNTPIPGRDCWPPWNQEQVNDGQIVVEPWPLVSQLPDLPDLVEAQFGADIQLYGYELSQSANQLKLTLYWQALNVPQINYKVFVHLVAQDGTTVAQDDRIPVDWVRPTKGWRVGEVLADVYDLAVPAGLPPGIYRLFIGLYDEDDGTRPEVLAAGRLQPDNQLLLRQLTIDH